MRRESAPRATRGRGRSRRPAGTPADGGPARRHDPCRHRRRSPVPGRPRSAPGGATSKIARSSSSAQVVNGRRASDALITATQPASAPVGIVTAATSSTSRSSAASPSRSSATRSGAVGDIRRAVAPTEADHAWTAPIVEEDVGGGEPGVHESAALEFADAWTIGREQRHRLAGEERPLHQQLREHRARRSARPRGRCGRRRGWRRRRGRRRARGIRRHDLDLRRDGVVGCGRVVEAERDERPRGRRRRPAVRVDIVVRVDHGEVDVCPVARRDAPQHAVPGDRTLDRTRVVPLPCGAAGAGAADGRRADARIVGSNGSWRDPVARAPAPWHPDLGRSGRRTPRRPGCRGRVA